MTAADVRAHANLPAVREVQVGERSQCGELDEAGVGEVPAVAGLQVLQRRQPRAVLQGGVRQVLVALPAASQLLHTAPGQALKRTLSPTGYLRGYRLGLYRQGDR